MVTNIHERLIGAPLPVVGRLIDRLASRDDVMWPVDRWPPVRFDRPLAVGAHGGHSFVRYTVEVYEPGRKLGFRFTGPRGFNGTHGFDVEETAEGAVRLRHVLTVRLQGLARLSWPLAIRWLHDALIEDALDCAESYATARPLKRRDWPMRVRLLRRMMELLLRRPAKKASGYEKARRMLMIVAALVGARIILGSSLLLAAVACAAPAPSGQTSPKPSPTISPAPSATAQPSPSASVSLEEKIGAAVSDGFGPEVKFSESNNPSHLLGDFNGDGHEDLAATASVEKGRAELKKYGVKFLDVSPFSETNGSEIDVSQMGRNCSGVAIIHGTADGWMKPQQQEDTKFLFYECFVPFSLVRKGSRIERGSASKGPTPKPKGDSILLELETGGSTLVYWDGKTYRGFAIREGD